MHKLLLILLLSIPLVSCETLDCTQNYVECKVTKVEPNIYELKIKPLIEALILVESGGNDSAYCKKEEAVGCLQIRPIMLKECNRVLELQNSNKRYKLRDRWSREKSIEIFHIINQFHNKEATHEEIARFWNGGPKWSDKSGTKRYWSKVKRKLKKLLKENDKSSTDWLAEV
jgi:hypothetical protein